MPRSPAAAASNTKSKYQDPLNVKNVAHMLNIPESVMANIVSFSLTIFLCLVTLIIGKVLRKAGELYLIFGNGAAYHSWHANTSETNRSLEHISDSDMDSMDVLYLQPLWKYLTSDNTIGLSPFVNSAIFPGAISLLFYYIACLPSIVLDLMDNKFIKKTFKIQPNKKTPADAYYNTLLYTLRNNLLFIVPGVLFQAYMHGPWLYADPVCFYYCTGYDLYPISAPSLYEFGADLLMSLIVFDAMYHYWHRWHHLSRPLYSHIHRIHHEYFSPFSWVTQYEHPLELFAVSLLSLVVPISLGVHPFTEWIWLLLAIQISVDAHSGYDFSMLNKFPLLFWGGARHHDIHHQKPKTNFQPFFTWFDLYYGTNDDGKTSRKKNTATNGIGTNKKRS